MAAKIDQRTTDTKERVLQEARRLFVSGGLQKVNFNQIAKTLHITQPAIYHHFPDGKEELILAMTAEYTRETERYYAEVLATHPDTRSRLRAMIGLASDARFIDPGRFIYDSYMQYGEEMSKKVEAYFQPSFGQILQVFSDGVAKGELRKIDLHLMFASFDALFEKIEQMNLAPQFLDTHFYATYGNLDTFIDAMLDLWLQGVAVSA